MYICRLISMCKMHTQEVNPLVRIHARSSNNWQTIQNVDYTSKICNQTNCLIHLSFCPLKNKISPRRKMKRLKNIYTNITFSPPQRTLPCQYIFACHSGHAVPPSPLVRDYQFVSDCENTRETRQSDLQSIPIY